MHSVFRLGWKLHGVPILRQQAPGADEPCLGVGSVLCSVIKVVFNTIRSNRARRFQFDLR